MLDLDGLMDDFNGTYLGVRMYFAIVRQTNGLRCPGCRKKFSLGIFGWPVINGQRYVFKRCWSCEKSRRGDLARVNVADTEVIRPFDEEAFKRKIELEWNEARRRNQSADGPLATENRQQKPDTTTN